MKNYEFAVRQWSLIKNVEAPFDVICLDVDKGMVYSSCDVFCSAESALHWVVNNGSSVENLNGWEFAGTKENFEEFDND